MNQVARVATVLTALVGGGGGCTEIPAPSERVQDGDDGAGGGDAGTGVDSGLPTCPIGLNLHLRGAGVYFAAGPTPNSGGWGEGGPFQPPDPPGSPWLYVDAYAGGIADELRGHISPLGTGNNATLATATHWMSLMVDCEPASTSCAGGTYYPVSGRIVATRIEPDSPRGFELQIANAVLRRGTFDDGVVTFADNPDECVVIYELWIAGESISVSDACAANPNAYLECILASTATDRHPEPE